MKKLTILAVVLTIPLIALFACSDAYPFRPVADQQVVLASEGVPVELAKAEAAVEGEVSLALVKEAKEASKAVGKYVRGGGDSKNVWKPSEATKQVAGLVVTDLRKAMELEEGPEASAALAAAHEKAAQVQAWVGFPEIPLVPLDPINKEAFLRVQAQPVIPTASDRVNAGIDEGMAWADIAALIASGFGAGGAAVGLIYLRNRKQVRAAQEVLKNGVKPLTDEQADRLLTQLEERAKETDNEPTKA